MLETRRSGRRALGVVLASLGAVLWLRCFGNATEVLFLGTALWLILCTTLRAWTVGPVLGFALALRISLFGSEFLSDDLYRYVWEGRVWLAGFNPFLLAPDAPELAGVVYENKERINHPSYRSIYPVVAQALFAANALFGLAENGLRHWILLIDFAAVAALVAWLRGSGRPVGWALVYGASPLVLASASSGHVDSLAVLFVALSGWALARGRPVAAGAFLALGALSKLFPLLLLPLALRREPVRVLVGAGAVFLLGFAAVSPVSLVAPLDAFARDFAFNGAMFRVAREIAPSAPHAVVAAGTILWFALTWALVPGFARAGSAVLLGLLLWSPTVHFWYLSWPLALAAVCWNAPVAKLVALGCATSLVLVPTYRDAHLGGPFVEHLWLSNLGQGPVWAGVLLLLGRRFPRRVPLLRPNGADLPPASLGFAVVIPARGERANLERVLPRWVAAGASPVLVADTPTGDGTPELVARTPGARYLEVKQRGYGAAVLAGLSDLEGAHLVVIADADHGEGPRQVGPLLAPFADPRVAFASAARAGGAKLSLPQRLGNHLLTLLIALRFGRYYRDLGPFRALRMARWPSGSLIDRGFGINVEMNVRAAREGLEPVEVLLPASPREVGQNQISATWRGVWGAARGMLRRFFAEAWKP